MAKEAKESKEVKEAKPQDKAKALELAMAQIEKAFGKEALVRLGDKSAMKGIEVIPTGALSLDLALGVGGLPRGRVVEIYGPEAGGKTTLSLHVIAQSQKNGGTVAFIDAEHALDPMYAKRIGVDIENLLISQPDSGEQALEITEKLVRSGAIDLIVIDSVAALVPKAEIEGEMGDSHVGLQARLMSQALRKLTSLVSKSKTCIIFINQLRQKIGVMFGNPETTPGGLALKFYASVRLDVRKIENLKKGEDIVGTRVRTKVLKNKVAPPYRTAEFIMMHGEGISREGCLLDMGASSGVVEKTGSWYIYEGDKLGQGYDNARIFLKQHPEISDKIEKVLRDKFITLGKYTAPDDVTEKAPVED
ncbi:MAG: recombinase RecA [Elusimicrobiaceae bacterium]